MAETAVETDGLSSLPMRFFSTIFVMALPGPSAATRCAVDPDRGLGIIIGVAAVVTMVRHRQRGRSPRSRRRSPGLGQNIILVFGPGVVPPPAARPERRHGGAGRHPDSTTPRRSRRRCATSPASAPRSAGRPRSCRQRPELGVTRIMGESEDYLAMRPATAPRRRQRTSATSDIRSDGKVRHRRGQTIVTNLFPDGDPVGKTLRIRNLPFKIEGVLACQGLLCSRAPTRTTSS